MTIAAADRLGAVVRRARGFAERRPPTCPPGWRTGPPDFVGIGVQKAGTSWWYRLVTEHPQVFRRDALAKELHFFGRFNDRAFTRADVARYHAHFPRPDGARLGEWTPRYLPDFWTHQQLREAAPDCRLLVLLRDPVDRYRSGITHEVNQGARPSPTLALEAMYRGMYHLQLSALLRSFPREQILVLQYEQCQNNPRRELARTYEFLGLGNTDFTPMTLHQRINGTPTGKVELPADLRAELLALYQPDVLALVNDFPEIDVRLWPNFRDVDAPGAAARLLGRRAAHLRSVPPIGE